MKNTKVKNAEKKRLPGGVWSAAPTAFTARMEIDEDSLARMLEHDRQLGINGYFIAGTNGEGPWLTNAQRRQLVEFFARRLKGQVPLAAQVTDNSAARMLDNIAMVREAGADIAVIAPPHFVFNPTTAHVRSIYLETIRRSPLPIGIYDRGPGALGITSSLLAEICAEPRVVLVKDSSADLKRMRTMLALRRRRPELTLLNGWEFNCVPYLRAGYDGLLLGGGVFNGCLAHRIIDAVRDGDPALAEKLQQRMNRMMYDVYGGRKIKCWLAGEKQLLVELGIFKNCLNYPQYALTDACRRAIGRAIRRDAEFLKV